MISPMSSVPSVPESPAPGVGPASRATTRVPLFTADAWAPLKVELFRSLWIATSIAQIGIWMREAAGPTLMENLTSTWPTRAEMVARVLVFSNLPIFLFSILAGALADVLDRRRVLIVTQLWMVAVSAVLGILTFTEHISPRGLLGFTFLLGVGTAAFGPALQAVLPELVPKQHFALAINMNSIALNVARALGPALFIVVVTFVPGNRGAGVSFMLSAASFVGAVWVFLRWKRPPQRAAVHGEQMWSAIHAGFRYTVYSPANRAILLRVLTFIVPAVVIWSQIPIIASDQLQLITARGPERALEIQRVSALLFAFVGSGAIFGVFLMPGLHGRYRIDPVVNACTALFAIGLILLSLVHTLWLAAIILIFLGINWVIIPTNFNTATQKSVPLWVKGRAISFYLTVLFGSFALGGVVWGHVTHAKGIHVSLLAGGISMLVMLVLAVWFPLTLNEGKDLAPAYKAPPEDLLGPATETPNPIEVAVRYRVPEHRASGLADVLRHDVRAARLRSGARRWRIEARPADGGQTELAEVLVYPSRQEYSRSFSRTTQADLLVHSVLREYHVGTDQPVAVRPGSDVPPTPGGSPGPTTSTGLASPPWFERQLAHSLDRIIDESFRAADRFRSRGKSKVVWRSVKLVVPAWEASDPSRPETRHPGPLPSDEPGNAPPSSTGRG